MAEVGQGQESKIELHFPPPAPPEDVNIIATGLAPQLGTDPIDIGAGRVNMRRLTVITDEQAPLLAYCILRGEKSRAFKKLAFVLQDLYVSTGGGRGRRDIIRMEAVARGGPAELTSEVQQPNWVARNIYDRGWEAKEKERLGIE